MNINRIVSVLSGGFIMAAAVPVIAMAAPSTVVVTPAHTQGWSTADTANGGTVTYVADAPAEGGNGSLRLTTDETNPSKAQYMHAADTSIGDVTELSYATKQVSGPAVADASYQVAIDTNGVTPGGFTTLVYEPYENGTVTPGVWQTWDVAAGQFWSSKTITCSNGTLTAGAGGAPFYTLQDVQEACPEAVVTGFGVNIGTFNPNYVVEADLVDFNGTTYNFETANVPNDKDACKNDGYQSLTTESGAAFKNQGDCVSYVASGDKAQGNPDKGNSVVTTVKHFFSSLF